MPWLIQIDIEKFWLHHNLLIKEIKLVLQSKALQDFMRKLLNAGYVNIYNLTDQTQYNIGALSLPTIGSWIMQKLNCRPQGQLLIWKTWSCVLIVGPRTWSQFPHTPYLEISTMEILFSWSLMILSLSLFGWEKHRVMLSKMIKMNCWKWWRCNGGSLWRKGQI